MAARRMRRCVRVVSVAASAIAGCLARPDPPPNNLAFVTSQKYPLMMFGSAADLDAVCDGLAGGRGHFVAWYSTAAQPAVGRLGSARGWVRKDGLPFADTVDDLVRGRIFYPLRIDEDGVDVGPDGDLVATATKGLDGSYAGALDCFAGAAGSLAGITDGTTGSWTDMNTTAACNAGVRFYCLQIDHVSQVSVPTPPAGAKLAFLSSVPVPATSLDALDGECSAEAKAHGAGDAFALVSQNMMPASARATGSVYARPDGVVAIDEHGALVAPINVTLDATPAYVDQYVWSGATNFTAAGSMSDTCGGWTGAGGAWTADSSRSIEAAFGVIGVVGCTDPQQVYCVGK